MLRFAAMKPQLCVALLRNGDQCHNFALTNADLRERGVATPNVDELFPQELPLCGRHIHLLEGWIRSESSYAARWIGQIEEMFRERVEEAREEFPPPAKYGRAFGAWRSPIFHLARSTSKVKLIHHGDGVHEHDCVDWWCGGGTMNGATFADELPDGCEVCQRCVEGLDFEQRRDQQQRRVDRDVYLSRTDQILADIEDRGSALG